MRAATTTRLTPPAGYYAPIDNVTPQQVKAGELKPDELRCPSVPPQAFTEALSFHSRYEGSDSARATLNPEVEREYREETRPIIDLETGVSRYVRNYMRWGNPQDLQCAMLWLHT